MIAPMPKDMHQPEEVEESDSDSELEVDTPSLIPRRKRRSKAPHKKRCQPGRRSKQPIDYKGMFPLFSDKSEVDQEKSSNILDNDGAFLSTLDLHGGGFQNYTIHSCCE